MSSLIKLANVTKIYYLTGATAPSLRTFAALKGIDFQLDQGEMIAIVGVSGSGKSTLMNIIGFLDHCTAGQYFFNGQDVSHLTEDALANIRNQKIGFVFQSFFLLPRLNALQNVMLPLSYRGIEHTQAKIAASAMLERVGMDTFATHYPNQLSGGQQQRVAIARALIGNPEVVLADEPTGSLDAKTGQEIMDLFLELNQQEQRTIIIVTHDREVSQQCQRVVTLKDGMIV